MTNASVKRAIDIIGALLLLVLTTPLLICSALLLLLFQDRPVLFRQQRIGRDGVPFSLLKFRTMVDGTPPHLPDRPVAKHPHDDRVTPLGCALRRLGIDELPQLINVLRGEMSLVGPRPLPQDDLSQSGWLAYVNDSERARRLEWLTRRQQVLPGLTGRWQITPNPTEDFENWIACDLDYVDHHTLWCDLLIVLKTPWAVLRGRQPAQTKPHETFSLQGKSNE